MLSKQLMAQTLIGATAVAGVVTPFALGYDLSSLLPWTTASPVIEADVGASADKARGPSVGPVDDAAPAAGQPSQARDDRQAQGAAQPGAGGAPRQVKPSFDVVRIDAGRPSVFAGRAEPRSRVIVLANEQPVATAKSDESGDWAVVSEHKFTPGDYQLALKTKGGKSEAEVSGQVAHVTIAAANPARIDAPVVEAPKTVSMPGPITFTYNETRFTAAGSKTADILARYLQQQKISQITLTGHADERGSRRFNIDLSRQRLDEVARFLRAHGFAGELELVPMGETEPYADVDRSSLPKEAAFQLDRRVELRLAR